MPRKINRRKERQKARRKAEAAQQPRRPRASADTLPPLHMSAHGMAVIASCLAGAMATRDRG